MVFRVAQFMVIHTVHKVKKQQQKKYKSSVSYLYERISKNQNNKWLFSKEKKKK